MIVLAVVAIAVLVILFQFTFELIRYVVRKRKGLPQLTRRERWDPQRFEELYNQVARQEGGHPFVPDDERMRIAEKSHRWDDCTLAQFARDWFVAEQIR